MCGKSTYSNISSICIVWSIQNDEITVEEYVMIPSDRNQGYGNVLFLVAQIMYHYGCSITDVKEQKHVLQLAFNALSSVPTSHDSTDQLFIYPMNYEYNVKYKLLLVLSWKPLFANK